MDEVPMVWAVTQWVYCLNRSDLIIRGEPWVSVVQVFMLVHGLAFAFIHNSMRGVAAFQVYFGVMIAVGVLCQTRIYYKERCPNARHLVHCYLGLAALALVCWELDFHFCASLGMFQGHALWHIFIGMSAFYGLLCCIFLFFSSDRK